MILGIAFLLSVLFIGSGFLRMNASSDFGGIVWLLMGVYPGAAGLALALLALGIRWVPVVSVVSPYLVVLSIIATFSGLLLIAGKYLNLF